MPPRKPKPKAMVVDDPPVEPKQEQEQDSSPVIATVGELAYLFENLFSQLVQQYASINHPEPMQAARETLTAGYNVAQVSISAKEASSSTTQRLVGFNR